MKDIFLFVIATLMLATAFFLLGVSLIYLLTAGLILFGSVLMGYVISRFLGV